MHRDFSAREVCPWTDLRVDGFGSDASAAPIGGSLATGAKANGNNVNSKLANWCEHGDYRLP